MDIALQHRAYSYRRCLMRHPMDASSPCVPVNEIGMALYILHTRPLSFRRDDIQRGARGQPGRGSLESVLSPIVGGAGCVIIHQRLNAFSPNWRVLLYVACRTLSSISEISISTYSSSTSRNSRTWRERQIRNHLGSFREKWKIIFEIIFSRY